jgi:pimeloyl-ACP methyl ester carboxylesterase
VARRLRAQGHEVHCPTLTGLGERSHLLTSGVDLDTHVADVVSLQHHEDLRDVVLAGHSYGGMVVTGVADRAPDRVAQLVYLDAVIPRDGESLADVFPEFATAMRAAVRVVDGVEVLATLADVLDDFGVRDPRDRAWLRARLSPHPWRTFEQRLALADEDAVRRLPRTTINCTATLGSVTPEQQRRRLDADRVWEVETGHDLMLTEPDALASLLGRLAS